MRSSFPASKTARLQVTADHDRRHVSTEGTKTLSSPPEPLAGRRLIAALNIQTDLNTLESKLCGSVNKHKIMWLFEQARLFPALNEKAEKTNMRILLASHSVSRFGRAVRYYRLVREDVGSIRRFVSLFSSTVVDIGQSLVVLPLTIHETH